MEGRAEQAVSAANRKGCVQRVSLRAHSCHFVATFLLRFIALLSLTVLPT